MTTFIKSFIIGICAILPGVSGSVIAVSLGIYEKFIDIFTNKRKLKENKLFITLVIIGIFCGVFLTGNIMIYIFRFKTILYYILTGIILSEIPFIIKKVHKYNGKKVRLLYFIIAFLFSLLLDFINTKGVNSDYSYIRWFLGGILFSFGKIFPGISSSFFLLKLGIYDDIIVLIVNPFLIFKKLLFYIPFLIGTTIGFLIFIKLLSYMLKNCYEILYSIILGFIISSSIILMPPISNKMENIIGFILMILFFLLFIYIKNKKEK